MHENNGADWLTASETIDLLLRSYGAAFTAAQAVVRRAEGGLVRTRARLLQLVEPSDDMVEPANTSDCGWTELPREFWRSERKAALSQNWVSGDFASKVDQRYRGKAFGVEFFRQDIEGMLPPQKAKQPIIEDSVEYAEVEQAHATSLSLPSDAEIEKKMLELIELGMARDVAAKVIRQISGFEIVGNEHARRVVSGKLNRGRPKKTA